MKFSTLLIDLDDTVYPYTCGLWDQIRDRIGQYMHEQMGFSQAEIPELRRSLYLKYGTTLRGLKLHYQVNELDFLEYVHDLPLHQYLRPDPTLKNILESFPQRRLIFTNADHNHARRVLKQLDLQDCFSGIIDILAISPFCKPMREAFEAAIQFSGESDPTRIVFIDDSPANLDTARAMGMFTIQVGRVEPDDAGSHAFIERLHHLPAVLANHHPNGDQP